MEFKRLAEAVFIRNGCTQRSGKVLKRNLKLHVRHNIDTLRNRHESENIQLQVFLKGNVFYSAEVQLCYKLK